MPANICYRANCLKREPLRQTAVTMPERFHSEKSMERKLLQRLVDECRPLVALGKNADYIPLLKDVPSDHLGICVVERDGSCASAGDAEIPFTIQSISKVLTFTCALLDSGIERVFEYVSVDPSDDAFNSVINLEVKNNHKPMNPMINAGSIVCMSLVRGDTYHKRHERILDFARLLSGNPTLTVDEDVYRSEKATGARNRALAYFMQSTGVIQGDVEDLLDAYFRACSIRADCADVARMALVYAANGIGGNGETIFSRRIAGIVKATMAVCGMYEESGHVAVSIGLPTKSGVGGGILSLVPGRMGIGIYGPALNSKGSSIAGLGMLEKLSRECHLSIFEAPAEE